MSGRWEEMFIEDVAQVVNGGTPKTKVPDFWGGDNLWITPAEMGNRDTPYLGESRRTLSKDGLDNCSASLVPEKSVILSTRAPIGHLVVNSVPMAFNQGCRALVPGDKLNYKFLYYFLYKNVDKLNELGSGTTFKELAAGKLKRFPIPVPPLDEQKRIVAILDEAFSGIDAAIANTEKNLANARELFESYLSSVFSSAPLHWQKSALSDICSIKHGFAFKSEYFSDAGPFIVLTPGSFYESGGFRDQGRKTKFYIGDPPAEYILSKDDFLIAMTEQAAGLLGSSLVVPESRRFLHNQRLGLVVVRDGVDWHNDFFFHQFNTHGFRSAVQETASGVKVRHTSPGKLGAIQVFVPSYSEQVEIGEKLNMLLSEVRKLESLGKQKLESLTELKKSLLQKAFSGELTDDLAEKELDEAVA